VSITFAAVEAVAQENISAIKSAALDLQNLSAQDIFSALGEVFARLVPALKPERLDIIRTEVRAADGPNTVRVAVADIGDALMVKCDPQLAATKIAEHARCLAQEPDNWAGVVWETVEAAGRSWRRLEIKANWS
jgi:hypothetical protein